MTLWRRIGPWEYWHFEPDTDLAEFGRSAPFVALWDAKKAGRRLPRWCDFDFYDFKGYHGWVSVFEISHDPVDWHCRLSGTRVDEIIGITFQGKSKDEVYDLAVEQGAQEFYIDACKSGLITLTRGPVNVHGREHQMVEFLELPCSDTDGPVTHTIELMTPLISNATGC